MGDSSIEELIYQTMNKLKACVGISAIIGGASVGIVALIAIFSPANIGVTAWVVPALCAMGGLLGVLVSAEARP